MFTWNPNKETERDRFSLLWNKDGIPFLWTKWLLCKDMKKMQVYVRLILCWKIFSSTPEKQPLNLWNYSNYDTSGLTLDSFDGTDRYWLSSIIQIIQYYNFLFYYLFFLSICSLQKQANMSSKTTTQYYSCCKSLPVRKDEFHFVCNYFLIVGDVVVEHSAVWWLSLTVAALVFVGHLPQTQR